MVGRRTQETPKGARSLRRFREMVCRKFGIQLQDKDLDTLAKLLSERSKSNNYDSPEEYLRALAEPTLSKRPLLE